MPIFADHKSTTNAMIPNCLFQPNDTNRPDYRRDLFESSDGDRRDGGIYVYYESDIQLAVCLALTTGRPLIVFGPTGCGKSELALNVARTLKWRYYEYVVTADSTGAELVGEFDLVRRLNDAQPGRTLRPDADYVEPGPLWWAFDPQSARRRGTAPPEVLTRADADPVDKPAEPKEAQDPGPWAEWNRLDLADDGDSGFRRAVVLIDEIDKAQVDLPGFLLVPLGSLQLRVPGRDEPVKALPGQGPLVIVTSNDERQLPEPFLRRCITLRLKPPDPKTLVEIAKAVLPGKLKDADDAWLLAVAESVKHLADDLEHELSTAEYLDLVKACHEFEFRPGQDPYDRIARLVLQRDARKDAPKD